MEAQQLREMIIQELPMLVQNNEAFRQTVLKISSTHFADKAETENRFERMMDKIEQHLEQDKKNWKAHLEQDAKRQKEWDQKWQVHLKQDAKRQKESNQKWQAYLDREAKRLENWEKEWQAHLKQDAIKWQAQEQKWNDWDEKWEENQVVIRNLLSEVKNLSRKHESTIGALGSRWGLHSEASFRNALKGILEDIADDIEVLNVNEYDDEGVVFGRPDQVELDIIIKNGVLIVCEIKSSMGKAAMYVFERKVRFYENRHNRKVTRMLVISPMIDDTAKVVAKKLGVEIYSYADDVDL